MNKIMYKRPTAELIQFTNEDVITTSTIWDNSDFSGCGNEMGFDEANGTFQSVCEGTFNGNTEGGEWIDGLFYGFTCSLWSGQQ